MVAQTKRAGSQLHRPDCQCPFCTRARLKVLRQAQGAEGPLAAPAVAVAEPPAVAVPPTPPAPVPVAEPVTPSPLADTLERMKRSGNMWFVGLGILLVLGGFALLLWGNASRNTFLMFIGAVEGVGGGFLTISKWPHMAPIVKGKVQVKTANCLVISLGRLDFVDVPEGSRLGIPQKCINDGRYYHVHYKGLDGNGSIDQFQLPDPSAAERYFDPGEALNCLRMPLSKKFFNYMPSQTQVVSLLVMAGIIVAEVIALIAMGG